MKILAKFSSSQTDQRSSYIKEGIPRKPCLLIFFILAKSLKTNTSNCNENDAGETQDNLKINPFLLLTKRS